MANTDLPPKLTQNIIIRNGYKIINQIGAGSFSTVHLGYNIGEGPSKQYALKLTAFSPRSIHEAEIIKELNQNNIVRCITSFKSDKQMCMVLEYCSNGDLQNYLYTKCKVNETMVKIIMQHMGLALRHLFQLHISHNDIKPSNILITSEPRLTFKLADFGIARVCKAEEIERWRDDGTRVYMAPEKLMGKPYDARADIWSLGVVMYQCLFGKPFFFQSSLNIIRSQLSSGCLIKIPANSLLSTACEDLLRRMLITEPNDRICFEDLFTHNFIDIENIQSKDNYIKLIQMFTEAIALDGAESYEASLQMYKKALGLLYPYMETEPEADRVEIEDKYNSYLMRVNELSQIVGETVANEFAPASSFDQLQKLAKSTPNLTTGIDIAVMAEYYLAQSEFYTAYASLEEALGILMPICETEPKGYRRSLLMPQIERWMKMAEEIKRLNKIL